MVKGVLLVVSEIDTEVVKKTALEDALYTVNLIWHSFVSCVLHINPLYTNGYFLLFYTINFG